MRDSKLAETADYSQVSLRASKWNRAPDVRVV
jgi:hypothetical protein